ncbi:MAG: hypothetical protein K0S41_4180 [Anaerocolumna sp.]|jgi:hypothetical protein|nr:hypothetical protein [Anaerocolumna sp.]
MKSIKKIAFIVFNILLMIFFDKLFSLIPENYLKNIEYVLPLIGLALLLFDICFVVIKRKYETVVYIIITDICFLISAGFLTYFLSTNDISKDITFFLKRNKEIFISYILFMILLLVRAYLKSSKFKISANSTDVSC